MLPIYRSLVQRLKRWKVEDLQKLFDRWCSFNLDEFVGLKEDFESSSFRSYMLHNLCDPLELDIEKLHIPNAQAIDPYEEASSYRDTLSRFGGLSFQLLGIGENGHVGFNEPPSSVDSTSRVVPLSMSTRRNNAFLFNGDLDQVPTQAITLGLKEILNAEEIHLVILGSHKSMILKSLLQNECADSLPASWLKLHQRVFLWTDYATIKASLH